jgi:hypothetical protein
MHKRHTLNAVLAKASLRSKGYTGWCKNHKHNSVNRNGPRQNFEYVHPAWLKKSKENVSIQAHTQADYPRNGEGRVIG